ncbi:MAG: hypothetical protein NZO58_14635 [Gemmataceae bacterium]|nr:hypothetical protein [Gemmataceae bacterium]
MSTFYLMPSRYQLGQRFAEFLTGLFPGTDWPQDDWHDLAEGLASAVMSQDDVYVVYAEDLPADLSLEAGLVEYFGAEPGDAVIEVRPGIGLGEVGVDYWRVRDSLAA